MLTTCPECTGKISDKAPRCPHCGLPFRKGSPDNRETINRRPKRKSQRRISAATFIAIAIAGSCVGILLLLKVSSKFNPDEVPDKLPPKTTNQSGKVVTAAETFKEEEGKLNSFIKS